MSLPRRDVCLFSYTTDSVSKNESQTISLTSFFRPRQYHSRLSSDSDNSPQFYFPTRTIPLTSILRPDKPPHVYFSIQTIPLTSIFDPDNSLHVYCPTLTIPLTSIFQPGQFPSRLFYDPDNPSSRLYFDPDNSPHVFFRP